MSPLQPMYVRLSQVQEVFGVSDDQVRIWARADVLKIFKRGRMSFVRAADLINVIEGVDENAVG